MNILPIILITIFFLSLIFSYLSMISHKNSLETIKDMGIGYNLGNLFDSFSIKIKTPEEQITLNGNTFPTKNMIKKLKKYGFKTIRFPVTWIHFIDDYGNIDSNWMLLVKEVINLIIKEELYCILNIYKDGYFENWLSSDINAKDKFINLWSQIANEFKDYNHYLIFESMDDVYFYDPETFIYNFELLLIFNQAFVNIIRNSGGNNIKRLLLVAGVHEDLDMTCSSEFKMPVDPSNKLALSLHYYIPQAFAIEPYYDPYNWTDNEGISYSYEPSLSWGAKMNILKLLQILK